MLYLLSPEEIQGALGMAGCHPVPGSDQIAQYAGVLGMALSRVEGLMGVRTLERGTYTDQFCIASPSSRYPGTLLLRLRNALLTDTDVTVRGSRGNLVAPAYVDKLYGMIHTDKWAGDTYTVTYESGLEKDSNNVAQDVPEWLKSIAINCVVLWYRIGFLNPKVDNNISYSALLHATVRELQTRVYSTYSRPRLEVEWPRGGV